MNQQWIRVAALADIPPSATLRVRWGSEPVCLYNLGGRIYATHDVCTHGAASLADGFVSGETIECPLHQGLFHIPTGKAVGVPCTRDVEVFRVRVEDGAVYIAPAGAVG